MNTSGFIVNTEQLLSIHNFMVKIITNLIHELNHILEHSSDESLKPRQLKREGRLNHQLDQFGSAVECAFPQPSLQFPKEELDGIEI